MQIAGFIYVFIHRGDLPTDAITMGENIMTRFLNISDHPEEKVSEKSSVSPSWTVDDHIIVGYILLNVGTVETS